MTENLLCYGLTSINYNIEKNTPRFHFLLETLDLLIFSLDFYLLDSLIQRKERFCHSPFVLVFLIHFATSPVILISLTLVEIISIRKGCLWNQGEGIWVLPWTDRKLSKHHLSFNRSVESLGGQTHLIWSQLQCSHWLYWVHLRTDVVANERSRSLWFYPDSARGTAQRRDGGFCLAWIQGATNLLASDL